MHQVLITIAGYLHGKRDSDPMFMQFHAAAVHSGTGSICTPQSRLETSTLCSLSQSSDSTWLGSFLGSAGMLHIHRLLVVGAGRGPEEGLQEEHHILVHPQPHGEHAHQQPVLQALPREIWGLLGVLRGSWGPTGGAGGLWAAPRGCGGCIGMYCVELSLQVQDWAQGCG